MSFCHVSLLRRPGEAKPVQTRYMDPDIDLVHARCLLWFGRSVLASTTVNERGKPFYWLALLPRLCPAQFTIRFDLRAQSPCTPFSESPQWMQRFTRALINTKNTIQPLIGRSHVPLLRFSLCIAFENENRGNENYNLHTAYTVLWHKQSKDHALAVVGSCAFVVPDKVYGRTWNGECGMGSATMIL